MKMFTERLDRFLVRFEHWATWFSVGWTALAVGIVILSNLMIHFHWPPLGFALPFDVKDNAKVALLLAPGGIVAGLYLVRPVKK